MLKVSTVVRGHRRGLQIEGQTYWIYPSGLSKDYDQWQYTLPTGAVFSHPTQFGALLMCIKHAGGDVFMPWEE